MQSSFQCSGCGAKFGSSCALGSHKSRMKYPNCHKEKGKRSRSVGEVSGVLQGNVNRRARFAVNESTNGDAPSCGPLPDDASHDPCGILDICGQSPKVDDRAWLPPTSPDSHALEGSIEDVNRGGNSDFNTIDELAAFCVEDTTESGADRLLRIISHPQFDIEAVRTRLSTKRHLNDFLASRQEDNKVCDSISNDDLNF